MSVPTWAIMAGGGTAGHLLPGLAVGRALVERGHDPASIHFVGSDRGVEATMVPAAGFTFDELPGRGIQRRFTLRNIPAAVGLAQGLLRGVVIVARRRPAVVIVLGGHASLACGVGAVLARRPLVLLEQNVRAGAVNRLLRRFCAASAVSLPGTDLPRAVLTGNPLRPEIAAAAARPDTTSARRALGLPADRTVIAVFSGSLGSRRINTAVAGLVASWADRSDVAVRHVIGRRDWAGQEPGTAGVGDGDGILYQPVEYEDRMHLLLQAADVAVTRAGGSVAELAAFGLPAVLVPLPIATRDHQSANAAAMVAAGGAVAVPDAELDAERLARELTALLEDPARLSTMAKAMRSAARPEAAELVADLVESVAGAR
ncbi:MAG: UDP-N-acetylglucosamine--N-acetylmuramyl-(pentapeptide) pyrophosphoryl-undecaprenol N-acetylglucosamine transferase [Acidimicrobiales bacterium]